MGKLSTYRRNRARRRAEEKALRTKAAIEAKANAKASATAEKLRAKADKKKLKENARDAVKKTKREAEELARTARKTAKDARKRARKEHKIEMKHSRGMAELELRKTRAHDKAMQKRLEREAKLEARRNKAMHKDAKAARAHAEKMASMDLKKIEAGQIDKNTAKRYLGFAQVLLPVLAPLALRGITTAQGQGAVPDAANPGSALSKRVEKIRGTLEKLMHNRGDDPEISDFAARTKRRLTDLDTALESAETVPTRERRVIHQSVSDELNRVNKDVMARLGVKA